MNLQEWVALQKSDEFFATGMVYWSQDRMLLWEIRGITEWQLYDHLKSALDDYIPEDEFEFMYYNVHCKWNGEYLEIQDKVIEVTP